MAGTSKATLEMAYMQVTGLSKSEIKKKEHQDVINNALEAVWTNPNLFSGETEQQRDERLDIKSAGEGKSTDLASYFRKLYPGKYDTMSAWAVIYTMYNRMTSDGENSGKETETQPELSDTNKTISIDKENKVMSKEATEGLKGLGEVEETLSTAGGKGPTVPGTEGSNGTLPTAIDKKAALSAVVAKFTKNKNDRTAFSKKAVIDKIVIPHPPMSVVFVQPEGTVGTVKDAQAELTKVEEKFGAQTQEDGSIKFTKVPTAGQADALAIVTALKEAIADSSKEFPVYVSNATQSIKGAKIDEGDGKKGEYKTMKDLTNIAMNKSAGVLRTVDTGIQLVMVALTNKKANGTKGTDVTETKKDKNKTAYSGIASLRPTDRKKLLANEAMIEYHKEVNPEKEHDLLPGTKSNIACKYIRDYKENGTTPIFGTYRIPLLVDKFKLVVVDDAKKVFGDGQGVARTLELVNIEDSTAMDNMLKSLAAIQTDAMLEGGDDETFAEYREAAEAATQAETAAQATKVGGAVNM